MSQEMNSYERLAPYYEAARQEAEVRQRTAPTGSLEAIGDTKASSRPGLTQAIIGSQDLAVIAEHKRRSPSEGDIRPDSTVAWTVDQYQRGGAAALSILTQNEHFGGSVSDISDAAYASQLPILRKDFIDTEYQLYEARAHGASAALLIVGGLSDIRLRRLHNEAGNIGLDCLVEVHDEEELKRALEVGPSLIGVNNRNLSTLKTDIMTAEEMIPQIPQGVTTVAESGYSVKNPDHIRELRELGVDAVLMGTALMREAEPAKALAAWLATDQPQE